MKVIQTIFALVLIAFLILFAFENASLVKLGMFGNKITLPVSFIAIGFYVFGAISGALILKVLKKGLRKEND